MSLSTPLLIPLSSSHGAQLPKPLLAPGSQLRLLLHQPSLSPLTCSLRLSCPSQTWRSSFRFPHCSFRPMEESSLKLSPGLAQCCRQRKERGEEKGRKDVLGAGLPWLPHSSLRVLATPPPLHLSPECCGDMIGQSLSQQRGCKAGLFIARAFQCLAVLHQHVQFPKRLSLIFGDFLSFPVSRGAELPLASLLLGWGRGTLHFPSASLQAL